MATHTNVNETAVAHRQVNAFERFAGLCGIFAAIVGILYSVSFVVLRNDLLSALFLLLGGLFATAVVTALYQRLRETNATLALWAFLLSIAGALGAVMHGGYDLANAINPVTLDPAIASLPSPVDPRGLLTFGVAGLGIVVLAWLIRRSGQFSTGLSYWGYLLGVLLTVLYLGRLILLDPKNPLILGDALLSGFLFNPIWYLWLGLSLWRGRREE
jgi:hypothetical protein